MRISVVPKQGVASILVEGNRINFVPIVKMLDTQLSPQPHDITAMVLKIFPKVSRDLIVKYPFGRREVRIFGILDIPGGLSKLFRSSGHGVPSRTFVSD